MSDDLGLSTATGTECCGRCGAQLTADERCVDTSDGDGYTAAGHPRAAVLCLGCAVLVGAT